MKVPERDYVHRRVVVEYGCLYVYVYITDGSGKLIDEESFKQPYRLDRRDSAEEAQEGYDLIWQHLSDTVLGAPLQDTGDEEPESDEED